MNRIFVREQEEEEYRTVKSRCKIGVMGMGNGVGTSFLATAMAKELAKERKRYVTYLEINRNENKTFLYDSLGMDKRFAGRTFVDFYDETTKGKSIAGMVNLDERINWALCVPDQKAAIPKKSLEPIELCRMINNITGDHILCDITWCNGLEQILKEMDVLIFVMDPMPSKLIKEYENLCFMKRCQLSGQKIIWVVNKYNGGVNKREFYDFVRVKQFIKVPFILPEEMYLAEYNCRIPYSLKSVNAVLNQPIRQILDRCPI
ncbi:hypothetical protein [Aminipila luticellarii]|uniref:CobQ/CobB/MinD/ParA nucleotide binding domain-containing protein n=1 Tax=Aminipila luticellarii TaxID=2507160 RepID=A0A410PUI6_9FIRM|nr:hypothetical protein [Aminipila luticellarii]QAT42583.1 hypothetical protein EQM06_04740 [Aminipila luticellarii]